MEVLTEYALVIVIITWIFFIVYPLILISIVTKKIAANTISQNINSHISKGNAYKEMGNKTNALFHYLTALNNEWYHTELPNKTEFKSKYKYDIEACDGTYPKRYQ